MYLLLDSKNIACAVLFEKPLKDEKFIEIETQEEALQYLGKIWTGEEFIEPLTDEEQEQLKLRCELEYIKCLLELNNGI